LRRLITLDLPRRLSRRLPRALTEAAVGVGVTAVFVGLRIAAAPLLGDLAPFPLAILGVVLAALFGGWRAGLVSMVLGTLLLWYFVIPPYRTFSVDAPTAAGLAVGILSQAVILLALALYQREVRRGEVERLRRINFLGHALREMDHRTKNNFQIVTSLLTLQANRSPSAEVQGALKEAAERLKAVAAVYDALAPSSQNLAAVRLHDQLEEMCGQIRRGILPEGIRLETELEPMLVPHETAVAIGIVVNELVTNACKHAFPDGEGGIAVRARRDGGDALIEVADDGRGYASSATARGLGTRLVAAFVQRVKGRSDVCSSPEGTVHQIRVPLGAGA
jgi:two-component system, sensor histidine kinase PdtaS